MQARQVYYSPTVAQTTTYGVSSSYDPKKKKKSPLSSRFVFNGLITKFEESNWLNQRLLRNNRSELAGWFALLILILVGYKFFSDGSFSAILTLSAWFQCFSMFLLNLKVLGQRTTNGISKRSVALIVLCLFSRLSSTMFYNGYLPVDRSGDWLYQGADMLSLIQGAILLAYSHTRCQAFEQDNKDASYILIPLIGAAVLALLVHPTLNQNFLADSVWTFALYLETYSMVPQLFMMGKLGGEVEALTSHYVASMAASKVFCVLFWFFSYTELAPRQGGRNIAGWAVLSSYSIQTLLFMDFLFYYIRSIRIGKNMIINL